MPVFSSSSDWQLRSRKRKELPFEIVGDDHTLILWPVMASLTSGTIRHGSLRRSAENLTLFPFGIALF